MPEPSASAGPRRRAAGHLLAAVLVTGVWLAATAVLWLVAELAVWKTARTSLGPLVVVLGFAGLAGSLFLLHRRLVRAAPRRLALTAAVLTAAGGLGLVRLAAALVSGRAEPVPRVVVVLVEVLAVAGPLLLAAAGAAVVRRAGSAAGADGVKQPKHGLATVAAREAREVPHAPGSVGDREADAGRGRDDRA